MKLLRIITGSVLERYTKPAVFMLLCLVALSYPNTQVLFDSGSPLLKGQTAWAQTPEEVFPNSTLPAILGNRSLIPGMHVMSLVNDVKPTWLIISSDNELSVNMRFETTTSLASPTVSLLATALKTTGGGGDLQIPPRAVAYERATGTNITQAGWISPITVPIFVDGTLSLYDADLIVVMIVPYTGPSLMTNSTTTTNSSSVLPQDQNVT